MAAYYWVDTFSHGEVPSAAIQGGHDVDGACILVGRAFHEGDWIPAKVIPDRNVAYVAYDGGEHAKHQYQVLCEQRLDWIPSSGGHIPSGAIEGGKTVDGEPLYVGRVHHSGAIIVGKVQPSHGVCYIPFDGQEMGHHNYEILILRERHKYEYKGKVYPPPPTSEPPRCTCYNSVVTRQQCPRCINNPSTTVHWPPSSGIPPRPGLGFIHPNRPTYHNPPAYPVINPARPPSYTPSAPCPTCHSCSCSGHTYHPQPVIPKPYQPHKGGFKSYYWVDTFSHGGVPSTAIQGGHDVDGARIFVGRAFHEGDWIPAKVIPDRNVAYVAYGGGEHAKHQYQVLCEQRFDWVPSSGGHIPSGAVEGGKTVDGEPLYVGRVHHSGAITVGKVHPSHGVCYIPFDGKEIGHHNYEILILRS